MYFYEIHYCYFSLIFNHTLSTKTVYDQSKVCPPSHYTIFFQDATENYMEAVLIAGSAFAFILLVFAQIRFENETFLFKF